MKTLAKYHSFFSASKVGADYNLDAATVGWREYAPGQFISETYFDLAGLSMDAKTLFPNGAAVQETLNPTMTGTPGTQLIVIDLMTTTPIPTSDPTKILTDLLYGYGYPNSSIQYSQVPYYRNRIYNLDSDFAQAVGIKTSDEQAGSLAPTASDRIYSYRFILTVVGNQPDQITVYPARHLIEMDAREEPEYQYLMRLKRSYDLQQSSDVDK